jgi:hypothetical protein
MNRVAQPKVKVTLRPTVSQPLHLCVESTLENPTLGRNFYCYHWEGCMWSMQCNVESGYQLSICSGTKENHRKPWSSWPVAGPSRCKLTSSQQSGIKYASPDISPYLCFCFVEEHLLYKLLLKIFLYTYNLDKHQTGYNTCGRNDRIYEQLCIQIYIYQYLWFFHYRYIWESIVVSKNRMLYEVWRLSLAKHNPTKM